MPPPPPLITSAGQMSPVGVRPSCVCVRQWRGGLLSPLSLSLSLFRCHYLCVFLREIENDSVPTLISSGSQETVCRDESSHHAEMEKTRGRQQYTRFLFVRFERRPSCLLKKNKKTVYNGVLIYEFIQNVGRNSAGNLRAQTSEDCTVEGSSSQLTSQSAAL